MNNHSNNSPVQTAAVIAIGAVATSIVVRNAIKTYRFIKLSRSLYRTAHSFEEIATDIYVEYDKARTDQKFEQIIRDNNLDL